MAQQHTTLDYTMVTQVILLQPEAETTDEMLAAFFKAVHRSQPHIPCLADVSTGENSSTAHRGFTHGIFLHFDRDPQEAKTHPKYQDIITKGSSLCDQVVIFELPETLHVPLPAPPPEVTPKPAPTAGSKRGGRPRQQPAATPPPSARQEGSSWRGRSAERIDERLKKIVIEQLGVDAIDVLPTASFVEDLGADSLDLVELIMSLEEVFKIEISDEDAVRLTKVGEAQAYLQDKGVL